jgi:hypothetical protein
MSQEVYQCVSCPFRIFFKHPTPGIFEDNNRGVRSDDLDLLSKGFSMVKASTPPPDAEDPPTLLIRRILRNLAISSAYTSMRRDEGNTSRQQILDLYGQFPHANAGCVVDRRRDRSGDTGQADLADAACANFVNLLVGIIQKVYLDGWRVGVNRHDVVSQTAIDRCAVLWIVRRVL